MIDIITSIVPIKWAIVKSSPRSIVAKIAEVIGVGEKTTVALDTSRYDNVLYQHSKPEPYTTPMVV